APSAGPSRTAASVRREGHLPQPGAQRAGGRDPSWARRRAHVKEKQPRTAPGNPLDRPHLPWETRPVAPVPRSPSPCAAYYPSHCPAREVAMDNNPLPGTKGEQWTWRVFDEVLFAVLNLFDGVWVAYWAWGLFLSPDRSAKVWAALLAILAVSMIGVGVC